MMVRVAQAIADSFECKDDGIFWENWLPQAQAAIAAMREPTEAMLSGACKRHKVGAPMEDREEECPFIWNRRRRWQKMIDAALSPPPPSGEGGK